MRIAVSHEQIAQRALALLAHTYGPNLDRYTFSTRHSDGGDGGAVGDGSVGGPRGTFGEKRGPRAAGCPR